MTLELANRRSALEAVLAVSRTHIPIPEASPAAAFKPASRAAEQQAVVAVDRAAVALLGRLLMLRPSKGTPIYQFAACTPPDDVGDLAISLAHASAVLVGSTLLIRTDAPLMGRCRAAMPQNRPLSDAFLPGLYHYRLDAGVAAGALPDGVACPNELGTLARQYRLVVVESSDCAASIALAQLCTGTVLVVRAGLTQVAAVRSAATRIETAGGRVLGAVLGGVAPPEGAR